jgi:hypothetical protein
MTTSKTISLVLLAGFLAASLMAQRPRSESREDDRGVGVARLTAVTGEVSKRHGDRTSELVRAESGTPLVGGDWVATAIGSRAEVRLDRSNFIRLGPNAEIRLLQLGERSFQIDVIRGTVSYTMLKHGEADVDLRAPNANVVPRKDGVYRVEVTGMDDANVVVRKGEAEVLTPDRSVIVKGDKVLIVRDAKGPRQVSSAPDRDAFDDWVHRRDRIMEQERGPVYERDGWYPGRVHVGVGWGWGFPWGWGSYWGPYWGYGGFYHRPVVIVRRSAHRR